MNERSAILCSGHVCVFRTTRKTQLVPFYRASVAAVLAHLLPRTFKSIIGYLVPGCQAQTCGHVADLSISHYGLQWSPPDQPWNIWDPDINYPAHIPIIVQAYLLLSPMHALFPPPGINHFTHRTQQSRYRLIGAYTQGTDAQLTPATTARRRAPSLVYNPHPP
jgi:hypothetical protein